jgi:putative peptidoglycan lipid II flippase
MNTRRVINASILIGFFFGLDKIIALARQMLMGRAYGITAALSAFNAANNLPDGIAAVIFGSALSLAFIPILAATFEGEGRAVAWDLFSRVVNWVFVFTAVLALLITVFADPLVRYVVVPKFSPEQQALTAGIMRLDVIALLIFSISGTIISGLQAQQHFLLPALAPVLYNVGQIIGIVFLSRWFGIYGLVYGVILGAALHLAIQVPGLLRYGFRWTPALDWRNERVRQVAGLMGPRLLTVAAIQLIFVATDNFASGLGEGAIAAIAFGWTIMQLPETVIGTAVGTALLPTLSDLAARGDSANLRRLLRRAIAVLLALTIPATLVSLVVVRPAVQLVFEGRKFTPEGTQLVVAAAQMFLLGVTGHSLLETAARTFYARKDALTPLIAAVLTVLLFLGLCAALIPWLGHAGIALANTLAFSFEALLLLFILWRQKVL